MIDHLNFIVAKKIYGKFFSSLEVEVVIKFYSYKIDVVK